MSCCSTTSFYCEKTLVPHTCFLPLRILKQRQTYPGCRRSLWGNTRTQVCWSGAIPGKSLVWFGQLTLAWKVCLYTLFPCLGLTGQKEQSYEMLPWFSDKEGSVITYRKHESHVKCQVPMTSAKVVLPYALSSLRVVCLLFGDGFHFCKSTFQIWNRWFSKTTDIDLVLVSMYLQDASELRICPCMESPCGTHEAVTRTLRFPLENPYVGRHGQAIFHKPCFPVSES